MYYQTVRKRSQEEGKINPVNFPISPERPLQYYSVSVETRDKLASLQTNVWKIGGILYFAFL